MVAHAQVVLHSADGLPENYVVNNWHFLTAGAVTAGDADEIITRLTAVYHDNHSPGLTHNIGEYLSPAIALSGHEIKVYDTADASPRRPVKTGTFSLASRGASANIPEEVALCLSWQAAKVSGVPQARRRNRVYFGPLCSTALAAGGSPSFHPRPDATFMGTVLGIATYLMAQDGVNGVTWCTYSKADSLGVQVNDAWVDDAWDTQRRRGTAATTRSTTVHA
jgi:hypothetical protein